MSTIFYWLIAVPQVASCHPQHHRPIVIVSPLLLGIYCILPVNSLGYKFQVEIGAATVYNQNFMSKFHIKYIRM